MDERHERHERHETQASQVSNECDESMINFFDSESEIMSKTSSEFRKDLIHTEQGLNFLAKFPEWASACKVFEKFNTWATTNNVDLSSWWGDQTYRAIGTIPINLAEGLGRGSINSMIQFYQVARGSAFEALTLLKMNPSVKEGDIIPMGKDIWQLIEQIDTTLVGWLKEKAGH